MKLYLQYKRYKFFIFLPYFLLFNFINAVILTYALNRFLKYSGVHFSYSAVHSAFKSFKKELKNCKKLTVINVKTVGGFKLFLKL